MSDPGVVQSEVIEASRGAKEWYRKTYAAATLFIAPTLSDAELVANADAVRTSMRAWRERGIMPFAVTALRFPDVSGKIWTTAVYRLVPQTDRIEWTAQIDFRDDSGHAVLYGSYAEAYSDDSDDLLFIKPERPIAPHQRQAAEKAGGICLAAFVWLNDSLASSGYSAKEQRVSRPLARAEGSPRMRWVIEIRKRGAPALSMRKQFAEVVRAAHAVRGHLRRNGRTGKRSTRVKPYIRGRGDAIQIKDYLFRDQLASLRPTKK